MVCIWVCVQGEEFLKDWDVWSTILESEAELTNAEKGGKTLKAVSSKLRTNYGAFLCVAVKELHGRRGWFSQFGEQLCNISLTGQQRKATCSLMPSLESDILGLCLLWDTHTPTSFSLWFFCKQKDSNLQSRLQGKLGRKVQCIKSVVTQFLCKLSTCCKWRCTNSHNNTLQKYEFFHSPLRSQEIFNDWS